MTTFNPDRSIGRWISMAYRLMTRVLNRELEPLGLSITQAFFLIVLFFQDGQSQEELSTILQIDKANTARALSKLESLGLITREFAPHDRRTKLVQPTDKARAIQPKFFKIFTHMSEHISERFTSEEQDIFLQMLAELVDSLIEQIAEAEGKEKSDICREMCPRKKNILWHPWSSLGDPAAE